MIKTEYHKLYYLAHKDKLIMDAKNYRKNNIEKVREYDRKRKKGDYKDKHDMYKKATKKYKEDNPEKIKAQNFINNLLNISDFTRDICSICGKSNAEFHHENYDLPYFGYWFCNKHHKIIHRKEI